MTRRSLYLGAGALTAAILLASAQASALGLKDCSDKFSAEKAAGSASGKLAWNDFRKAECGANAKPVAATTAAPAATPAPAAKPAAPATAAPATAAPATVAPAPVAAPEKGKRGRNKTVATPVTPAPTGPVTAAVFPSTIGDAYKAKKAGKARELTCLDQYKANKANNANGGLRWIEKGGGYYSQCNKKLKG